MSGAHTGGQLRMDYNLTFKSEYGARVLADIEKLCGVKYPQPNLDTNSVMYREGRRSVYLAIERRMNEQPVEKGAAKHDDYEMDDLQE